MLKLIYDKRNKEITVPESWDELTAKQFIRIAGILHSDADEPTKYLKVLAAVCGKSLYAFFRIPVELKMRCFEHLAWIFEKQDITKQLIPTYKGLYGPESEFNNLVLAEFHHAEMAYYELTNVGNDAALDELCAILYRLPKRAYDIEKNKDGDVRVPFAFGEIEYHKKMIKRWPIAVKQGVLLWYDGCRQSLVKAYPAAFTGGAASNDYFQGLYKMIRSLSGDKYGTFDKVEVLSVHTAFMEIVESKQEEAELKSQYNL